MAELLVIAVVGVIDIYVLAKLHYMFRILKMPEEEEVAASDLPTVSICIPARNETHAMTQCLERVVASEYPKLEVIVLDDGSRDNTSMLIKSFAYAGVRFVEGKPLPDGWLGKNYAQSILAREASGKLIFFMDVDTLIERHTLRRAVQYYMRNKSKMLSVIPIRNNRWETSTLFTTMRHFWTMVRFSPDLPRAASNAWLVDRKLVLDQLDTDKTLPMSLLMETTIARKLADKREYRLVMSNAWLGVRYEKKWSSQIETSIRLLYPQCDTFWLQVVWLVVLLGLSLTPYVLIWWQPLAVVPIVLQFGMAYYYLSRVWTRYRVAGAFLLPATLAQEAALLLISMYRYKYGTITWKNRPVSTLVRRTMKSTAK